MNHLLKSVFHRKYIDLKGKNHFIPPPSVPTDRGGIFINLPLDGGGLEGVK
jgi:hypothetical protein